MTIGLLLLPLSTNETSELFLYLYEKELHENTATHLWKFFVVTLLLITIAFLTYRTVQRIIKNLEARGDAKPLSAFEADLLKVQVVTGGVLVLVSLALLVAWAVLLYQFGPNVISPDAAALRRTLQAWKDLGL
jgi:hypothetical protein